jgi:hypothetical protein
MLPFAFLVENLFNNDAITIEEMNYRYELFKKYIYNYRPIKGDGNCFYRAVIFRYLEIVILNRQIDLIKNIIYEMNESFKSNEIRSRMRIRYDFVLNQRLVLQIMMIILNLLEEDKVIEAHYLFDMPYEKIDTILHKESIVHSLVEYEDGVIKAAIGSADMRTPIAYALRYPSHSKLESKPLSLIGLNLSFDELSKKRFPCLEYAYIAAKKGGCYLAVLNAANEAAVWLFLNDYIKFLDIEDIIYNEINNPKYSKIEYNLENVLNLSNSLIKEIKERFVK